MAALCALDLVPALAADDDPIRILTAQRYHVAVARRRCWGRESAPTAGALPMWSSVLIRCA
jgi:hypothetical protein